MDGSISTWLAHRTWYAIALSSDVDGGRVHGADFFGHRLVVYRDTGGTAVVLGGQCPHMGADLSLGSIVGDDIQCMFHHFCFGPDGSCTNIPSKDRIPSSARVASFPVRERWGVIWAFNGDEVDTEPPGIRDYDDDSLAYRARRTDLFPVEPWVILGNSFDFQHLRYVHALEFEDPDDMVWFDDGRVEYDVDFSSPAFGRFHQRIRVCGTNTVSYVTTGAVDSMGLFTTTPTSAGAQSYYISATPRTGSADEIEERLAFQEKLADDLLVDDIRAFTGMRFDEGAFVGADRHLVRWFRHARTYPQRDLAATLARK
jgi:phenylpropionate dioxygenase-like ring-hydroxylating dioxygenase large terminal subunit